MSSNLKIASTPFRLRSSIPLKYCKVDCALEDLIEIQFHPAWLEQAD